MTQMLRGPSSLEPRAEGLLPAAPMWAEDEPDEISSATAVRLFRRRWLSMLVIFTLCLASSYLVTRITTPVYRASTTLYFAERQGSIPALDILSRMDNGNNEVATEMEVMRSRALAGMVVDSLGMQVRVIDPSGAVTSQYLEVLRADPLAPDSSFSFKMRSEGNFEVRNADSGSPAAIASVGQSFSFGGVTVALTPASRARPGFKVEVRSRSASVDALLKNLSVNRPNRTASVVQVAYTGHDRMETKSVPDVLAALYLAWRSALRKTGDRSTVEFLRRQIDTISIQLRSAEDSLRRFREANQVVDLPTQGRTEVERLAVLEAQRGDFEMQRTSLRNLMVDVKNAPRDPALGSPYRRLMAFPGLMIPANPAFPLLQSLTDLEQRRADLLVRRTQNDPDVQSLTKAIGGIESQIGAVVDTYLKGLDEQAAASARSIAQFQIKVEKVPRREVDYARLDRTTTGLTQIYTMLQTRLREAQIAEAVEEGAVRVVDRAALPEHPIAPRLSRNLIFGGLLGLMLALILGVTRERLDRTIHSKEEVEAISSSAVLALIPHIGEAARAKYFDRWSPVRRKVAAGHNGNGSSTLHRTHVLTDTKSVASEAYRKLRTNITFARADAPPRVLIFTSPAPGDGKTTSVVNLAIALAQQGKRVLVIDADMRRGGLHKLLNGEQSPGLSEILVGQVAPEMAVQSLTLEPFGTVDLLATGVVPPNPAELLASPRFRQLIETFRPAYEAILIDSPPINLVTDAAIIGRETDGAVMVVRAAKTTRGDLGHAISQLRQVQIPITGMILNDYRVHRDGSYGAYYQGYSYEYRAAPQ